MLSIQVRGSVVKEGLLSDIQDADRIVELNVDRDDLGVFRGYKRLFWAIDQKGLYSVQVVGIHARGDPVRRPFGNPGLPGLLESTSARMIFFWQSEGMSVRSTNSDEELERLTFVGVDRNGLHFVRDCAALKIQPESNTGFREEMWFGKGVGLVRLEQWVDGTKSMIWTLEQVKR